MQHCTTTLKAAQWSTGRHDRCLNPAANRISSRENEVLEKQSKYIKNFMAIQENTLINTHFVSKLDFYALFRNNTPFNLFNGFNNCLDLILFGCINVWVSVFAAFQALIFAILANYDYYHYLICLSTSIPSIIGNTLLRLRKSDALSEKCFIPI